MNEKVGKAVKPLLYLELIKFLSVVHFRMVLARIAEIIIRILELKKIGLQVKMIVHIVFISSWPCNLDNLKSCCYA